MDQFGCCSGSLATLILKDKVQDLINYGNYFTVLFFSFQDQIMIALEEIIQIRSGLDKNVSSITNIKQDASNLERINRWSCRHQNVQ